MSDQDAAAYHEQRQQIDTIGWLQSYEQEEEDIQVDKKLQIGTGAYLVFKSCDDAMGGADSTSKQPRTANSQGWRICRSKGLPKVTSSVNGR